MKLRYLLKKTLNIKTAYILVVLVALILVVGGYFSYALFTTSSEQKGALNIVTGNLYSLIESNDLDSNKSITITPGDDKVITIELKNVNGINSKHNLYYETTSNNIKIGYTDEGDTPPTNTGYVLTRSGTNDSTKTIKVRIKNKNSSNVTITFGTTAGLPNAELAFPEGKSSLAKYTPEYDPEKLLEKNPYILAAYKYDEDSTSPDFCLGGAEPTCKEITDVPYNYEYPTGTIVKYKVNDTDEKYFNVLYDNDKDTDENNNGTLTLQQRENTVYETPWCSKEDYIEAGGTEEDFGATGKNDKGPITILKALEEATKTWKNVNNQTYTAGETVFGTGDFATNKITAIWGQGVVPNATIFTNNNQPSFTKTNVKARLITAQESGEMGCKTWTANGSTNNSCKRFISNYLWQSTTYGGTVEDDYHIDANSHNYGYWALTTNSSVLTDAVALDRAGFVGSTQVGKTSGALVGARAVININKNNRVEL